MSYLETYILTLIESIQVIFIALAILDKKLKGHWLQVLIFIPVFVGFEISKLILPDHIATMLGHAVIVLFIMRAFNKKALISFATMACSIFIVFAIQSLFTGFLSLFVEVQFIFEFGLIIMLMVSCATLLLYLHVPLFLISETLEKKTMLLALISTISLSFLYFAFYLQESVTIVDYSRDFGMFLLMILVIVVGVYSIKIVSEAIKKKEALEYYKKIERPISEFGIQQSGIEKNIQLIHCLARINDFDRNVYHIHKHLNNFDNDEDLKELRRHALSMYLYVKINRLKDKGIDCNLKIVDYFVHHEIKDYILLQALDIIIDNAVEALNDGDNKIYINVTNYKDNDFNAVSLIEVLNKHEQINFYEKVQFFEKGFTTKKGKRGMGLYKLDSLAGSNNFNVYLGNEEINGENYVSFGVQLLTPKAS